MGTFNDQLDNFKHDLEQTKTDFNTVLDSQQDQITKLGKQAADATTAITSPQAEETLNDTEGLNATNDVANVEQDIDDEDENKDASETISF